MKEILRKKPIRISLYLLGILVILFFLGRWFVQYRTKDLIERTILEQTNGRVNLKLGKVRLALYPRAQIHLQDTRLEILDSASMLPSYAVRLKYLGLQLQSLRSFLFQRELLVDYLIAENPEVSIYPHIKPKKRKGNAIVHAELGNIYMALQRVAQSMRVQKLGISDGKLHLGSPRPDDKPVDISDIDFQVDEFEMAASGEEDPEQNLRVSKLKLRTGNQDITFPNGDFRMRYRSLEINSTDNSVRIDSFYISGMDKDTAYGSLQAGFRNLRLVNIDFKALYEKDLIKVDSLYCEDPDLSLNLDITARKNAQPQARKRSIRTTRGEIEIKDESTREIQDQRVEKRLADLLGKMDIGYLGLINADIRINTKNGNRYTPFATEGNNFQAAGIRINGDNPNPVEIDNLVFAIKNYKASTADSLYDFYFDSVAYRTGSLTLRNLRIEPSRKNTQADKKYLAIPDFELRELSLAELFSNKRFKAQELVVRNSRTINYFIQKSAAVRAPRPIYSIIEEIGRTVDLNKIRFENAFLLNQSVTNPDQRVIVSGINSEISANQLLKAPTYEIMGYSIGYLRFDTVKISNGPYNLQLSNGEILGKDQRIRASRFSLVNRLNRTSMQFQDVLIKNYHFDDEFEQVGIDSFQWKNASVIFEPAVKPTGVSAESKKKSVSMLVRHITAGKTLLQYVSGDTLKAEADLAFLDVRALAVDNQGRISLEDIAIGGNHISYMAPALQVRADAFNIRESGRSSIANIRMEYLRSPDTVRASIPMLNFEPRVAAILEKRYPVIREITIDNPVVFASLHSKASGSASKPRKEFSAEIGKIDIRQADLNFYRLQGNKSILARTRQMDLSLADLNKETGLAKLSLGNASISTQMLEVRVNDSISLMMNNGGLMADLERFSLGRGKDSGLFQAVFNRLDARSLSLRALSRKGNEPFELNRFDIGGEAFRFDSLDKAHMIRRLKENPSLFIKGIDLRKTTAIGEISAFGIGYRNGGRIVSADSMRYRPLISRDSFSNTLQWQKVFLDDFHTGKITLHDLDIEQLVTDSTIDIRRVDLESPFAAIYKDKRVPFNFSTIKPLPTDMLKKAGRRIHIDSIRIGNAGLVYEEFSDKTNRFGSVHFKDMRALVRNVKTFGYGPKDSLYLLTYATMEDSVRMRVHVDQSYTDTLSAFYMSVRIAPFSLPALNPMLEPLASARVTSGYLDTLQMRAIGREYLAHGKMRLYYRDLKVNILSKENQQRKTIGTRLMNFVANLVIHKKNAKKTGAVFAERVRERGFLNYWIKILLGGALTNTGIRKNSKAEKKYRKAMKKDHVPEIPEVEL